MTAAWKRGHWPDCYVNHGPPDATCDMGPDCGTVTPETLTNEMVHQIADRCWRTISSDASTDDEHDVACDLSHACHDALVTDDPPRAAEARQRICDVINARSEL